MILVVNYANEVFRQAQMLCTAAAKFFGADEVLECSPQSLTPRFVDAHKHILSQARGNGYWLWKPFIIRAALERVNDGDYIFYIDSGAALVNDVHHLIDAMNAVGTSIMVFEGFNFFIERVYTKRDAFILMDCDSPEYADSPQRMATYLLLRKDADSIRFADEYLRYCRDERILTDIPNQLGRPNYPDFKDNRHDQTVLSLLSKKWRLSAFRDPSQYGLSSGYYEAEVLARSPYPQVTLHHRRRDWTMQFEEYAELYAPRSFESSALDCALELMRRKFYSDALTLLLHAQNSSEEKNKATSFQKLHEIHRIAQESGDKKFSEPIVRAVYRLMAAALEKNITANAVAEMLPIARRLRADCGLEQNLKEKINAAAKFFAARYDELKHMDYFKAMIGDIIKYLDENKI